MLCHAVRFARLCETNLPTLAAANDDEPAARRYFAGKISPPRRRK